MKKRLCHLMIRSLALCLLLLCISGAVWAQNKIVVTGKIVDQAGNPVPGVSVTGPNVSKSVLSDANGNYSIIVTNKNAVLKFTSVGFNAQDIKVNGRNQVDVKLSVNAVDLDDVVVVGYGTQKKKEVTGAVASVKSEVIERTATSDLGAAIQGQIAGVNVIASSGAPGAVANIQIRGVTSVNGNNSPLYVVDGIPYDGTPNLSPNEIEKIDVLKDGASAAVYGTRAASGVILITTKQGKAGQMKVNFDSYYGIQKITSGIGLLDLNEYLYTQMLVKRAETRNITPPVPVTDDYYFPIDQNPRGYFYNTNWLKELQNDNAATKNYSLRLSGGRQELLYSITMNHFDQEGVLISSKYRRSNVRANATFKKNKFTITTGMGADIDYRDNAPWQLIYTALRSNPYLPGVSNLSGDIQSDDVTNQNSNLGNIAKMVQEVNENNGNGINGTIDINYHATKNLNFKVRAGGNYGNNFAKVFQPKFAVFDANGIETPYGNATSTLSNSFARSSKWTNEYSANYNKRIKDHFFQLLGVFSMEKSMYQFFNARNTGIPSNETQVLDAATGVSSTRGNNNVRTLVGSLARLQYNYKGRYLLSASIRRDGSSRFGPENRYATFPGVSLGWNVSDEKFWDPIASVASSFKLRASYGQVGFEGIGNYQDVATVVTDYDYVFGNRNSENLALGIIQTSFANSAIKWETSVSKNIGFDAEFLRGKITLSGDVYHTDKRDMLFAVAIPPTTGGGNNSTVLQNIGNMTNKGVEVAAGYHSRGKRLQYNVNGTFTLNRNLITKTANPGDILYSGRVIDQGSNSSDLVTVITRGYEAGAFFLIPTAGIVRTDKDLADYKKIVPTAQMGDLIYTDVNGDGKITDADRIYHGSGAPRFESGLSFDVSYSNFDFAVQVYGSFGAKVINGSRVFAHQWGTSKDLVYQWSPANPNSDIPQQKISGHLNNRAISDFFLEDGTFVRLRNATLGYTLPNKLMSKANITRSRVYFSAQNLFTFTKYTGFDPEVGNDGLNNRGIDKGNYPVSAMLRLGVQLDF